MLKITGFYRARSKSQELFNTISNLIPDRWVYIGTTHRSMGIIPFVYNMELLIDRTKSDV